MNPFLLILLIITFVGSEILGFESAEDWSVRILAVFLTAAMVPAVALFQAGVLIRSFRTEDEPLLERRARCQRMMVAHSLVWLAAAGAIVWALRWQDVVLGNWQLHRWPLAGEFMILAPSLLAMGCSWLVWFDLYRALQVSRNQASGQLSDSTEERCLANKSQVSISQRLKSAWRGIGVRWSFASHRFRFFFLSLVVPVAIVWFVRHGRVHLDFQSIDVSPLFAMVILAIFALTFPFLMLLVWKNRGIRDLSLAGQLDLINYSNRLRVSAFREWQTNGQIANAGVIGFFPFARFIFLSDVIIERFPLREIAVVVRHEAGHIARHHAFLRMVMLAIPMLVWLFFFSFLATPSKVAVASPMACTIVTVVFLFFGGLSNRWIAHQTEWDADLFAIMKKPDETNSGGQGQAYVCPERSSEMIEALYRLSAWSGRDFRKGTLFHPSTRSRIDFIARVSKNPELIEDFRQQFRIKLTAILLCWLSLGAVGIWLNQS